ncbi:MAG: thymidine phosphorylase [Pseudomonadota bacterium]
MDARSILYALRERQGLSADGLRWFAEGLASGSVSDAQAGAFAMGVLLNGISAEERVALTLAMRDSGDRLEWDLPGPVVDKHSTGGLGDCVSLLLSPMLAACGAYNPMISGRGLGHTGGTLDKMEAIPGLSTEVDEAIFRAMVGDIGCAIVAASADMAPADKRLYAVRDVTSTVESLDLITASILSKKLAAGLGSLILDVKVGSGAFMATMGAAEALAQSLVETANGAGCKTAALITDMDQPLAPALGNALEVAVVMEILTGQAQPQYARLVDLTVALGAAVLELAGMCTAANGETRMRDTLADGSAAERFGKMVDALGGPPDFLETWQATLPVAPVQRAVPAPAAGVVTAIDGRALGEAVVHLGGGRLVQTDRIDPSVGLSQTRALGDTLEQGDALAVVHAADDSAAEAAAQAVLAAYVLGDRANVPDLIRKLVP